MAGHGPGWCFWSFGSETGPLVCSGLDFPYVSTPPMFGARGPMAASSRVGRFDRRGESEYGRGSAEGGVALVRYRWQSGKLGRRPRSVRDLRHFLVELDIAIIVWKANRGGTPLDEL